VKISQRQLKFILSIILVYLFLCQPVYAKDDSGSVSVISTPTAGNEPSNLTALAKSSSQIALGWKDNSTNETGFKIERKIGGCSSTLPWTQIATKTANATNHTVLGLNPNTTYAFRVRAYQSSTNTTYSNCVSVKTSASGTPPAPTNLKATPWSSSKVNLTWADNATNETGFKIYRKAGTSAWTLRTTTGANTKSFSDTTAADNSSTTIYQYYILAYNSSGNSPKTYTATVPYPPANLTATQGESSNSIKLTWTDKSSNETGFEIYRKSGEYSFTSTWTKVATLGANKTSWTNSGLTSGSRYSYKIRAYCKTGAVVPAYGYSLWSLCQTGYCSGTPSTFRLPDTGQTKCYDDTGEIPCPKTGELFYGQDASYSINPKSYTKLDSNGNALSDNASSWVMVKDNNTGLIWENKTDDGSIHDKDNLYSWYDPNPATNGGNAGKDGNGTDTYDFITSLNVANFGGFNDWRMPTIMELSTIVNAGTFYPAINTAFYPNTKSDPYWSSTTFAGNMGVAWYVYFLDGDVTYDAKSKTFYVRAVRGGQSGALDQWVINGDGTVTDKNTGLMWQKDAPDDNMIWEEALAYCENLNLAFHNDWRLPNRNELQFLVDHIRYDPASDTTFFPDTMSFYYWSSTTRSVNTGVAWSVNFSEGYVVGYPKSGAGYVRAVRGGQ
jgi:hypothetical protein